MRMLILCFVLLAAGCARTPLAELKINAQSPIRFAMWRVDVSDRLSREQWRLFDQATQELKFQIMLNGEASGSAAVDEAFRSQVDGKLLYEAVRYGLQLRLNRFLAEKAALEKRVAMNARLKTREGDVESAQVLRDNQAAQTLRIEKLEEQIAEAEDDMALLEKTFHPGA